MNCDNCTENTMKVCAGETATKSLRDMTDTDFDAAHELPNAAVSGRGAKDNDAERGDSSASA